MNVYDVFTKRPRTANANTAVRDIAIMMKDGNCGCIPVVDKNDVIGIITDRDITIRCLAAGLDPGETRAFQIMTPKVVCCHENDDIEKAVNTMVDHKVRRLPVFNQSQSFTGIVSLCDLALGCSDDALCGQALERLRLSQ